MSSDAAWRDPWRILQRSKPVVRAVNEKRRRLTGRAAGKDIVESVAIHVGDGEAGTELRKLAGQQKFAAIVVEGTSPGG